jgi:LysR family cys regulon transcriptional activator
VVPPGHPLLDSSEPITLKQLAAYPIITYELGYTGRAHIDNAFADQGLHPDVVLTAMDADVIKTYVELGMGVGIVASIALDPERDRNLRMLDAGHLFQVNVTRLGLRRGAWLRGFAYSFIETFVPTLTKDVVVQAVTHAAGVEG